MASAAVRPEERPTLPADSIPSPLITRRGALGWSLASTGLLLGGGAVRLAMTTVVRPDDLLVRPPFPLDTLPRALETWNYVSESETRLDPLTVRTTGSTDHSIRSYYDEMTGTSLSVLVLYGPAEPVIPHTPQACYPASGYHSLAEPIDRTIPITNHAPALFRSGLFAKSGGRTVVRQAVYHSYRLDGVWSPMVSDRSLPRRWAGLFKVQVQRRVHDGERADENEPIEGFLRQLLPKLEEKIAASASSSTPPPTLAHG